MTKSSMLSKVGVVEASALERATNGQWKEWVDEFALLGEGSRSYESLRSAKLAVSPVVTALLVKLSIDVDLVERISVFVRAGRPLRAAIATLVKGVATKGQVAEATAYIHQAFSDQENITKYSVKNTNFEDKVFRVYASNSAVTFEAGSSKNGRDCLQVEAAPRQSPSGPVEWHRKIIVQLKDVEVLQVLAVLRGWLPQVEFAHHGDHRDKRMTFQKQPNGGGFLVSVRQGHRAHLVPMAAFDSYGVSKLVLRVLAANSPDMSIELINEMARDLSQHGSSITDPTST